MPTYIDERLDEAYRICNRHGVEDCEVCNPRHCQIWLKEFDDDNPESHEVIGVCAKCTEEDEDD